jgi:hypothetical protein
LNVSYTTRASSQIPCPHRARTVPADDRTSPDRMNYAIFPQLAELARQQFQIGQSWNNF